MDNLSVLSKIDYFLFFILKTLNCFVRMSIDWSTPIKQHLIDKSKKQKLMNLHEYNIEELNGFLTHGIQQKFQVLMNILKNKNIYSQNQLKSRKLKPLSQHTIYYGCQRNRISFSMHGDGGISKIYGKNGICFISNDLDVYRACSNSPYEWFHDDYVSIDKLTIAIDKDFANTLIYDLDIIKTFYNKYRDNNRDIMINIAKFLHEESKLPINNTIYDSLEDSTSSVNDDHEDQYEEILDLNKEEFSIYCYNVLEHFIEQNELGPCNILNLVLALIKKYDLEHKVKVILVNYESNRDSD